MLFIFLGVIPYLIFLHMVLTRCAIFKNSDLIKMIYIECGIVDRIFFIFIMSNFVFYDCSKCHHIFKNFSMNSRRAIPNDTIDEATPKYENM